MDRRVKTSLRDRLLFAMSAATPPVTKAEIARACGISTAAVAKWFRVDAPTTDLKPANLLAVCKLLDVRPEWLTDAQEPMRPSSRGVTNVSVVKSNRDANTSQSREDRHWEGTDRDALDAVPVLRWSGVLSWLSGARGTEAIMRGVMRMPGMGERVFALEVQTNAMEPEFKEGWLVYVDPDRAAESGDFVIVQLMDRTEPLLRELVVDGGARWLRARNPAFPEHMLRADSGRILGVVVFQGREY